MARTESVEKAKGRMAACLKEQHFHPLDPVDFAERGDAFVFRKDVGDHHLYVEAVFGEEGPQRFFRLNVGFGGAGLRYEELPFLGDEKGARMPLFRAMMFRRLARVQQRFYNLFLGPRVWNHAAKDTFYYGDDHYGDDQELLVRIDEAAALIIRIMPPFIAHLRRANFAISRLRSPYLRR